jgi:hypothetical protein
MVAWTSTIPKEHIATHLVRKRLPLRKPKAQDCVHKYQALDHILGHFSPLQKPNRLEVCF